MKKITFIINQINTYAKKVYKSLEKTNFLCKKRNKKENMLSIQEIKQIEENKLMNEDFIKIMFRFQQKFEQSQILFEFIPSYIKNQNFEDLSTSDIEIQQNEDAFLKSIEISQCTEFYSILSQFNQTKSINYLDQEALTQSIQEPLVDMISRGGKRIRPLICFFIAEALGKNWTDVIQLAAFCECLHGASLIIDDIEDNSEYRRQKKCIHKIYGTDISINAANFFYFRAFQKLMTYSQFIKDKNNIEQYYSVYLNEMANIHIGQALDIQWSKQQFIQDFSIPSEQQYLCMVKLKTGVLLRMAIKFLCLSLKIKKKVEYKLENFVESLGIGFQIQDDIINLNQFIDSLKQRENLKANEDLQQGKMTLIMIHCINNLQSYEDKINAQYLLIKKNKTSIEIQYLTNYIKQTNSINYCSEFAKELIENAYAQLQKYLPHTPYKFLLYKLSQFIFTRTY